MAVVGVVTKEIVSRKRIADELMSQEIDTVYVHSAANFDLEGFDFVVVDLNADTAWLLLKTNPEKCVCFVEAFKKDKLDRAKKFGCSRVYKLAEFFKKTLPEFKQKFL